MAKEKDIADVIAEEAEKLEDGDDLPVTETPQLEADDAGRSDEPETPAKIEAEGKQQVETPVLEQAKPTGLQAPENWSEEIKQAFSKADPVTQQVWLDQQKEFQRGFNTVAQEAAELRRYQQSNAGVDQVLSQVIPHWRAQGMTPEQGLGQLVQLGIAYASNPSDTILRLAQMAGLDITQIGQNAPYRTSEDIKRDTHLSYLERKVQQFELNQLQSNIANFQNETDSEGRLAHPLFNEAIDGMTNLFNRGFNGSLKEAYEQVVWTTPALREKLMRPAQNSAAPKPDPKRNAEAERAMNAVNQRVKSPKPAPASRNPQDDLSVDDLVASVAAQLAANG